MDGNYCGVVFGSSQQPKQSNKDNFDQLDKLNIFQNLEFVQKYNYGYDHAVCDQLHHQEDNEDHLLLCLPPNPHNKHL